MPLLKWDPVDFLELLSVVPEVDEDGIGHRYCVDREPLRLEISVWQYDSDISIKLFCSPFPEPVAVINLLECPGVRAVHDKQGSFLEFAPANTFSGRYDGYSPIPYGLRLTVEPQIKIEPFSRQA